LILHLSGLDVKNKLYLSSMKLKSIVGAVLIALFWILGRTSALAQTPYELRTDSIPRWRQSASYIIHSFDDLEWVAAYRGKETFIELGISARRSDWLYYDGLELGVLNNFASGKDNLTGFSLNYYSGWALFEFGLTANYYTNWDLGRVYLKPYIGAGILGILNVSYGHNFSLGKNHFEDSVSSDEFRISIRYMI
jgi:hypothetical protein